MCNIAGYAGEKRAAPILIEMLRKQQQYDGGGCAGIATIHNGRIYYRKVIGDVDTLVNTTDALYLPGTVGIAHTRPGGTPDSYTYAHPFINLEETLAGITNGTSRAPGSKQRDREFTTMLEDEGFVFRDIAFKERSDFPSLKSGGFVSPVATRVYMVEKYIKEGMSTSQAIAKTCSECYRDAVFGILNVATPDRFYVLRTTRPAISLKTDDGTYVATTRFGFPEDAKGEVKMLPLFATCEMTEDGVFVTDAKMTNCEEVAEVSDYTLEEGYRRIYDMLKGKKDNPLHFDDLELAVWFNMRDLFEGNHTLIQDARLVYDVLYRLHEEGLLKKELRRVSDNRERYFMWID